jgi:hypothetical protein
MKYGYYSKLQACSVDPEHLPDKVLQVVDQRISRTRSGPI